MLRLVGTVLVFAFYAVIIWCYLRRGPAVATSGSVTAHAAAVAATWLPFALPLLRGQPPGSGRQALGCPAGVRHGVVGLVAAYLGRNVSVIAQARDVVTAGPYRWVRHPLYPGEIVSALGLAIAMNSSRPSPSGWRSAACRCTARCARSRCCCRRCLPTALPKRHRGPAARRVLATLPGRRPPARAHFGEGTLAGRPDRQVARQRRGPAPRSARRHGPIGPIWAI